MGILVAIDGGDGSGKKTQCKILAEKLIAEGRSVRKISFPNYESKSSELVNMYLHGEIGQKAEEINPYAVGTFYAADRFISFNTDWKSDYKQDKIILADRYTTANVIHQGAKIDSKWDRIDYYNWVYSFEYGKMGLPREDIAIILVVEPEISMELIRREVKKRAGT